jgi:hypothetical protein
MLYTHSPKIPGPFFLIQKINKKCQKITKKEGYSPQFVRQRAAVARQPSAGALTWPSQIFPTSSCPQIFAHVVNSCWLAPVHARLV